MNLDDRYGHIAAHQTPPTQAAISRAVRRHNNKSCQYTEAASPDESAKTPHIPGPTNLHRPRPQEGTSSHPRQGRPPGRARAARRPHRVQRAGRGRRPRAGLAHAPPHPRPGAWTARRPAQHRPRNPPAVTNRQPHPSNKLRAAANGPAPLPNRKAKP
jgi:hypothetical protein